MTVSLQRGTQRQSLNAVSVTSATQLQATVPANLPGGLYDLVVQTSAGQRAVLANAFSVLAGAPQILEVLPNQGVIQGFLIKIAGSSPLLASPKGEELSRKADVLCFLQ